MKTKTRFAPSPTGFLHIGGARTALFNWLFARNTGGEFLLRIEDTDRKRSTDEAISAILNGLEWLGLSPDQPPVYQSRNEARHAAVVEELLASGAAFKCYVTPEELAERRSLAEEKRQQAKDESRSDADRAALRAEADALMAAYRSPYRDGAPPPAPDAPCVVRLRAPDGGRIEHTDGVQGLVGVNASDIDDLVLMRSDGTPTYMLAVVVDDHDMGITHIIRGDDHLINSFRQIPIFTALGWDVPEFSHVSLIHGSDGAKLSKRHGALGVEAYRDLGYLPAAITSYLSRLGWSDGSDDILTKEEIARVFTVEGLKKSPARIDFEKMAHVNAHFLKESADDIVLSGVMKVLEADRPLGNVQSNRLAKAISVLKTRGNTFHEIATQSAFLLNERPIDISAKARKKLNPDALQILADLSEQLETLSDWSSDTLEASIKDFCENRELGMGKVGPPLRTALTGGLPAPDLGLVLEWFGKTETLSRVQDVTEAVS